MLRPQTTSASLALPLSVLGARRGDMLYSAQEALLTLNPEDQDTDFICSHGLKPPCGNGRGQSWTAVLTPQSSAVLGNFPLIQQSFFCCLFGGTHPSLASCIP